MKKSAIVGIVTTLIFSAQSVLAAKSIDSPTTSTSLQSVVKSIFDTLLAFLPIVATIYLAISGYRYMIAQGNPDLVEKAKKNLTYAVIGAGVAYGSVAIIALFGKALGFDPGFGRI